MKTEEIKRLVDGKFTVCRAELCATVWHLTAFCILFTNFIEKKKNARSNPSVLSLSTMGEDGSGRKKNTYQRMCCTRCTHCIAGSESFINGFCAFLLLLLLSLSTNFSQRQTMSLHLHFFFPFVQYIIFLVALLLFRYFTDFLQPNNIDRVIVE